MITWVGESLTVTQQGLHNVGVRRKAIHPSPPSEFSEWLQDAATVYRNLISHLRTQKNDGGKVLQDQHESERSGEHQRGNLHRRGRGRNSLANGRIIEWHQNHQEKEGETGPLGWVPYGPVPAEEQQSSTQHVPGQFNEDLSGDPSGPTIHLARPFPDLINISARNERYLKLLSTRNGQNEYDEDRKKLVLDALHCVRALVESEADEKTRADVQHEFGCDVGRIAPDCSRTPFGHGDSLVNPRGGVFGM